MQKGRCRNIGRIEWVDLSGIRREAKISAAKSLAEVSRRGNGHLPDFNLNLPGSGETLAGICHARGMNANLPAQWLMYVRVADVAASATEAERLGKGWTAQKDGRQRFLCHSRP